MHSTLKETWSTHSSALLLSSSKNRCPTTNCPSDPYVQPGMLHFGNSSRETRWIPFHVDMERNEGGGTMKMLSEIDQLDVDEVEEYAAEALMAGLVDEREKAIEWARDAYVLFLGRKLLQSNKWSIFQLGFGMVDDENADWWKSSEWRPLTFEERIPKVMVPGMDAKGLDAHRKPDLVVLSSLFWDESYIGELAQHYNISMDGTHGFSYAQIKWHRLRVQRLISFTREWFNDQSIPMMFRTRQIRKQAKWGGLLKIFQLDQSCRAVAKEMGLRYFTWGGKLEGFQE
ncbi:hypothetical protein QFC21_004442 [Naganishia friedmannii]|uniref:Uncharacterized protein n=1 Tax=Naganishia friedmannii TaxID=89922 RepID=A0ACC2VG45_9TREE|nr:hypothetical protein QFC21_004442 [Naganishia friedmannii]